MVTPGDLPAVESSASPAYLDSVEGMLLLSAYGDALGAPREVEALRGEVGDFADPATLRLASVEEVAERRIEPGVFGHPWALWPDEAALAEVRSLRGLVTDDTAVRSTLLEEWLWEGMGEGQPLSEARFMEWLLPYGAISDGEEVPWLERRKGQQAREWRAMYEDARRFHRHPVAPESFVPHPRNRYYRPGRSVCFGPFLFLPLAALFHRSPALEVFRTFAGFSHLDQETGRVVTGLMASLLARAVGESPFRAGFGEWLHNEAGKILQAELAALDLEGFGIAREAQHRAWILEVEEALAKARDLAVEARAEGIPDRAFLQRVAEQIYRPAVPLEREGLEPFEPVLMLSQIYAAATFGGADLPRTLSLLAAGPGDSDTLPYLCGLLAGAWYGRARLAGQEGMEGLELEPVEELLWRLFRLDLPGQAAMYGQRRVEAL